MAEWLFPLWLLPMSETLLSHVVSPSPPRDSGAVWLRVAIGAVAALLGALLRQAVAQPNDPILYLAFLPVVELAALAGGVISAMTGIVCSIALANGLFRPVASPADVIDMAAFSGGVMCLPFIARYLRARHENARPLAMAPREARQIATLEALIDASRDGIFALDADGRVLSVNRAGLEMFAVKKADIVGARFVDLLPADSAESPPPGVGLDGVHLLGERRANGEGFCEGFPAEIVIKPMGVDGTSIALVSDLSEHDENRRRIEKLTVERLSAISGITTMLAHQINQPLTAAKAYLNVGERLIARLPDDSGAMIGETVEKAGAQILRAAQVMRSLRELVAVGEPDKTLVKMNELIDETLAQVSQQARDTNIKICINVGVSDDYVVADRAQIKQVLSNIVRNAMEAMQGSTRRELIVSTHMTEPGLIRVEVTDTGQGISGADAGALFEPFMTTEDKGMGIALSMCRAIVEAHYGHLWARQNAEGGATFGFDLPLREKEPGS